MLIARTESLRAYRTAAIDSYAYNSQVVGWWRWVAAKDPRTCPACLALDGTEHPLTEQFGSHPGCRCVAVCVVKGREIDFGPTGREWFSSQSESRQLAILGRAKFRLYTVGKITLDDLVHRVPSKWGPTAGIKSIGQLVREGKLTGEEAAWARSRIEIPGHEPATGLRVARSERRSLPGAGLPNMALDKVAADGTILQRRLYGDDGRPRLDIDFTDHGQPKKHPIVPHAHDWPKGIRTTGSGRRLTQRERKLISDLGEKK